MLLLLVIAFGVNVLQSGGNVRAGEIIFDSSSDAFPTPGAGSPGEFGDEVHAAGTARLVTLLEIGVKLTADYPIGTSDFQARLYANDGMSNAPGSLLWESPVRNQVPISGTSVTLVGFDVPMVAVPDAFTWTLQYWNSQPTHTVLSVSTAISVGDSPDYFWFHGPTGWRHFPGPYADLAARITAVREPQSWFLLLIGSAGLLRLPMKVVKRMRAPGR